MGQGEAGIGLNPFTPGAGRPPPYLAGRADEQRQLAAEVDGMKASGKGNTVIMYGPRGMGKTVLVGWLEELCERQAVDVVSITAKETLHSVEGLAGSLLAGPGLLSARGINLSLHGSAYGIEIGGSVGVAPASGEGAQQIQLTKALTALSQEKPLALLLDEAHAPPSIPALGVLLEAGQAAARKAPFLLALVGTPGLEATLKKAGCTFSERDLRIGVGRIDAAAAADAIRVPMEKASIEVADGALARIVEDSQGYPYFLQEWGKALWEHLQQAGKRALGKDEALAAEAAVQAVKADFYYRRYQSLERDEALLAAANAVAEATQAGKTLDAGALQKRIAASLGSLAPEATDKGQRAWELLDELNRIDLVWRRPKTESMEPGIPSFMAYLQSRAGTR